MLQAGQFVKEEVARALLVIITNANELHGYAVRTLYRLVDVQLPLTCSACGWCIDRSKQEGKEGRVHRIVCAHQAVSRMQHAEGLLLASQFMVSRDRADCPGV